MKKLLIIFTVLLVSAVSLVRAHPGGGTVIIPPDPIYGEPGDSEGEENLPIQIELSVHPKTLNLSSRGRFVTAYLKASEDDYRVEDIDRTSIKITEVNGDSITPIEVMEKPWGYEDYDGDGSEDLMVKFKAEEVRNNVPEGEEIIITVQGLFDDEQEFYANNTIRTINNYKYSGKKKNFNYNLQKNIPDGASIDRAVIWIKSAPGNGKHLLRAKRGKGWTDKFGTDAEYFFLPAGSGRGYKWEVSEEVVQAWENGEELVSFEIDYDPDSGEDYPHMIVDYNSSGSVGKGKKALTPKFVVPREKSFIDLYFRPEDIDAEEEVAVYGLNSFGEWVELSGVDINEREGQATVSSSGYSQLQVVSGAEELSGDTGSAKAGLGKNYPNPFNPATTIEYTIPEDADVTLRIYNSRGQRVATVVNKFQRAGSHTAKFEGGDKMPPGMYYYQLRAGSFTATERMAISR